jgi:hypothetical protein
MGLWEIISVDVAGNLGMNIANILLLLLICGNVILMAKNFQLGIMLSFFISGVGFMVTYNYGINYAPFLAVLFISLVIMVFTYFFTAKSTQEGVGLI